MAAAHSFFHFLSEERGHSIATDAGRLPKSHAASVGRLRACGRVGQWAVAALVLLLPIRAKAWQTDVFRGPAVEVGQLVVAPNGDAMVLGADNSHRAVSRVSADGEVLSRTLLSNEPNQLHWFTDVATDAVGDIFASGQVLTELQDEDYQFDFAVVKLSRTDGSELWRFWSPDPPSISASGWGLARALVVDAAGDVIVTGSLGQLTGRFTVIKLSGATGAVLWQSEFLVGAGRGNMGWDIALTPTGDVVAVGMFEYIMSAIKLDGTTGAEIWRTAIPGAVDYSTADHVAIDPSADVVLGGILDYDAEQYAIAKLSGADGQVLWQTQTPTFPLTGVAALTLDGADVVVGGGRAVGSGLVAKLSGPTGAVQWQYDAPGSATETVRNLALLTSGDVVWAGRSSLSGFGGNRTIVSRIGGADGALQWRREFAGRVPGDAFVGASPSDLRLDPAGNIIVAAAFDNSAGLGDSKFYFDSGAVLKLTGEGADSLAGDKLVLREADGKVRLAFKAKVGIGITLGPDSDPTLGGALLEVRNPLTGETGSAALGGWNYIGSSSNPRGFRHRDPPGCRVTLRANGALTILCKDVPGLTLDEASQGSLIVRLTTGGAKPRVYCAVFGGTVGVDQSLGFRATDAPAPDACPFP